MTMQRLPSFVILAATILLAACHSFDLRGPAELTGLRPKAHGCDPLESTVFTAEAESTQTCGQAGVGMPLQPGMVLRLSTPTWGAPIAEDILHLGNNVDVPPSLAAQQPQLSAPLRLPIRKIGPNGALDSEEILVLGAFLSLQRAANFGSDDPAGTTGDNLSAQWQAMLTSARARAALWNAFVDAASLRRIVPPSGISKDNRALALVFSPKAFCNKAFAPGGHSDLALTQDQLELLKKGLIGTDCTTLDKDIEVFALSTDASRADPLAAIVIRGGAGKGLFNPGYFPNGALNNPATIVTVEIGGVSMRDRDGAERRWSLAEWEESGICGDNRRVRKVNFRGATGAYRIVGRGGTTYPSFQVDENLSRAGVVRRAVPVAGARWRLGPAIPERDLDKITANDISHAAWTAPWTGSTPDPCQP